jgi:hypothetical protein
MLDSWQADNPAFMVIFLCWSDAAGGIVVFMIAMVFVGFYQAILLR